MFHCHTSGIAKVILPKYFEECGPEELVYITPGADGLVDLVEFIKCKILKLINI